MEFRELPRTTEGRRLYEAQSYLNRQIMRIAILSFIAIPLMTILAIRWLRSGVAPTWVIWLCYLLIMALPLIAAARATRVAATQLGGCCHSCSAPLVGESLTRLLAEGRCRACGRAYPWAAA
jgi:hypothetical protein